MKIMLLRLEGALQSWGEHSRWDHRDTADMPTKSGIVGLLGCAMGLPRGDGRLHELANGLKMAARADRTGSIITDFHTVQSRVGKFSNAEGKPRGDTIITPREYVQDACYTIFLTGSEELLNVCCEALRHPVWVTSLGRRNCPPSRPLLPLLTDDYSTLEEAVQYFRWSNPPVSSMPVRLPAEVEDANGEKERNDHPIDSSAYAYQKRKVRLLTVKNGGGAAC